jgi:phosphoribosylformimino-5-aminoimidazole carboxamide ribotide isomerase
MQIIPAIDIIDGKCVRLTQGDYSQKKIYNENPLEVAKEFESAGINRLHLVDLDGAKAGAVKNWNVLESIATNTELSIDFGGGIKQEDDLKTVLNAGASMATIGSLAVKNPDLLIEWVDKYGADRFFLGADVREEKIAIGGWMETTDVSIFEFLNGFIKKGITQVFCTDISKDGKLEGPAIELYKKMIQQISGLNLVASGGVSNMDDVEALKNIGCSGVIIGKAIYEGRITLKQLIKFI